MDNIELVPEEFVVEKNLNYNKEVSVDEGVSEDDETIKTSLLHLRTRTYPRPSAAALLPLTLRLHRRRVKTLSLPPPMTKPN